MKRYQLIIPMSGVGKRFKKAGYDTLKPLIKINGASMIEHVRSMYPRNIDVLFICSKTELDNNPSLIKTLNKADDKAKIVSVKPHKKGPGWAINNAISSINFEKPTFVNYCDFFNFWDFSLIDSFIKKNNPDGLIFTYRDQHPHTIWSDSYAHIQNQRDRVINIREKKPFTENPEAEFKSSGTYFFKSGKILIESIQKQIKSQLSFKEEFYISLTYLPMLNEGLDIRHYEIEHFFQWGTPEDLRDFKWWLSNYKNEKKRKKNIESLNFSLCLLCGGKGKRFQNEGFTSPKPLLPFAGESLAEGAVSAFKNATWKGAVLSPEISKKVFNQKLKNFHLIKLDKYTRGQADSAMEILKLAPKEAPVVLASSDLKISFTFNKFLKNIILNKKDWVIVFLFDENYPFAIRKPNSYSWVGYEEDIVKDYSFKSLLTNCDYQAPICGSFMFSSAKLAKKYIKLVLSNNLNDQETYIDDVLPILLKDKISTYKVSVDSMNCLGTPEEYLTNFYYRDSLPKFNSKK